MNRLVFLGVVFAVVLCTFAQNYRTTPARAFVSPVTSSMKKSANALLDQPNSGKHPGSGASAIKANADVRLDNQEPFVSNGVSYKNYQIQLNGVRRPSTIAQAHVNVLKDNVSVRDAALRQSLNEGKIVWVD